MPDVRVHAFIGDGDRAVRGQRGAASLIVVMILFFVVSMVAAYTNRNLIFEQKTASNQQRSTRALEAAEAGVEWALTLLNSGRITNSCQASASVLDTTFRQRYLVIDPANGNISPNQRTDIALADRDLYPTCVYNGTNWICDCPSDADPSVTAPVGTDIFPAFRVRFRRVCTLHTAPSTACNPAVQPGVVHIDVNGCTTLSDACLRFNNPAAVAGEGRATVHVVAALRSALPTLPAAALTARGAVTMGAASLGVTNSEVAGTGVTIQAGGAITGSALRLQGKAGTPGPQTLFGNDAVLAGLADPEQFFINAFGTFRTTFRDQPAAIDVDCTGGCTAAALRARIALNPGRVFWVRGNLDFDSPGDIGSSAFPVVLNVTGNVTFSSPVTVYGLVYSQSATWTSSGAGSIVGAAMAEGAFVGTATTDILFDMGVITRLRTMSGSFVRVPGSWRDFET